jgi:hypothetical protein
MKIINYSLFLHFIVLYSARRLIGSRIIVSAAYCNPKLLAHLYFNSTQNTSVNWIIRLLLSLLCWPKVILLSGGHCISIYDLGSNRGKAEDVKKFLSVIPSVKVISLKFKNPDPINGSSLSPKIRPFTPLSKWKMTQILWKWIPYGIGIPIKLSSSMKKYLHNIITVLSNFSNLSFLHTLISIEHSW